MLQDSYQFKKTDRDNWYQIDKIKDWWIYDVWIL